MLRQVPILGIFRLLLASLDEVLAVYAQKGDTSDLRAPKSDPEHPKMDPKCDQKSSKNQ